MWGESVFYGSNGIAGAMMPVDIVKLVSVPNTQFKEVIRPVPMLSGQFQLTPALLVGAYYQFRWKANRMPAVGSYFSQTDTAPEGAEQLLLAGPGSPFLNNAPRLADQRARNAGQGGVELRWRNDETDYGFYLVRFHSKTFQQVNNIGPTATNIPAQGCAGAGGVVGGGNTCFIGGPADYHLAYHEGITALGGSFSHTLGDVNLAGETSIRFNQDLASSNAFDASAFGAPANDNRHNTSYALGRTAHLNLSALWTIAPNPLFHEATLLAEVAWNRVLAVTHDPVDSTGHTALDPNATRSATALRAVFEPTYRQVASGVDLGVPIGLGYSPRGSRSMALGPGAFPSDGGGDFSIGLDGSYLDRWRFGLSYVHYFGPVGTFLNSANAFTYKQSLADRDFVSLALRTTF